MTFESLTAFLRQRFTRVTSSVAYIPQLDGLRSLALLLVIGHHVFSIYLSATHRLGTQLLPRDWPMIVPRSPWVNWGLHLAFGVQIFFAISGFVLAMPFAKSILDTGKMPSVPLYLLRRLIRLEPPYLLSMTLFFLAILFHRGQPHWYTMVMYHIFGPHYLASIVYLHALIYGIPSWLGGIAWTLEIEIQFYLFMPILAQVFRVRQPVLRRSLLGAFTVGAGYYTQFVVPHLHNPRWQYTLLGNFGFFLAGVLLADIYLHPPASLRFGPRAGDACAATGAALIVYILHWQPVLSWTLPFVVILFYFGVFHHGRAGSLFRSPWLTVPGTMCYSIYLYHFFILEKWIGFTTAHFPAQHALWLDWLVLMVVSRPILLVVSAMMYLLVERPCVILSHSATRRWKPAVRTSASEVAA
jgi:peptidoglycan/LPS O-acetylase OafA/YrhL